MMDFWANVPGGYMRWQRSQRIFSNRPLNWHFRGMEDHDRLQAWLASYAVEGIEPPIPVPLYASGSIGPVEYDARIWTK